MAYPPDPTNLTEEVDALGRRIAQECKSLRAVVEDRGWQTFAYDYLDSGSSQVYAFDGTGNPAADAAVLGYLSTECQWQYSVGIINYYSDMPMTELVVNALDMTNIIFFRAVLRDLESAIIRDCNGVNSLMLKVVSASSLTHLEITGGDSYVPPDLSQLTALQTLILSDNIVMEDPPSFAGLTCPGLVAVDLSGCTHVNLTAAKMDTVYSQLDALTINAGAKEFTGNGRYTSASDAARASLEGKGWTITP